MSITRFAPSPTGYLHLGHAYAALVAKRLAGDGRFLLRFEDIDHTRIRAEFYEATRQDLLWLGLDWDEEKPPQLKRSARHATMLGALKEMNMTYPCFCTRRDVESELAAMASAPQGPEGPLYPGTCRSLADDIIESRLAEGWPVSWRLDAGKAAETVGSLHFEDRCHGRIDVDPTILGDVVLGRKDIANSYHLSVVIDDADDGIECISRGEDLLVSTHVHRVLQVLLGLPAPQYLHHSLVCDASGRRLAKRDSARSIRHYRENGHTPAKVLEMLPPLPC